MNKKTEDLKLAIEEKEREVADLVAKADVGESDIKKMKAELKNSKPYKFQEKRWGDIWKTLVTYDEPIRLALYEGELSQKYDYRLLDTDDKAIKHWKSTYGEPIYIDTLSENPLEVVFKAFRFNFRESQRLINLWLKANEGKL